MNDIFSKFMNKTAAVLGAGISNTPLIEFLVNAGAEVSVRDIKKIHEHDVEIINRYKSTGIKLYFGEDYLNNLNEQFIFRSPGIRPDSEHIKRAIKNGSVLTSETELFFEYFKGKIIAVTGSDGKSTTTTLIYELLKNQGISCYLGGNIGTPLISFINTATKDDIVVAELSSFQLMTFSKSPHIAVVTNINPNHLDYHKDYDEYVDAKRNICSHQQTNDALIVNFDDEKSLSFADYARGEVRYFSLEQELENGAYLKDNSIYYTKNGERELVMASSDILIRGRHNIANYLAAITAVHTFVSREVIKKTAGTFKGVPHRLELVKEINGVSFYNSSIDSSPSRTAAALSTFDEKIILIAGGKSKGVAFDALGEHVLAKVKVLILTGMTAGEIHDSVVNAGDNDGIKIIFENDFNRTVQTAYEHAAPGDCVLLSPASTSFDRFMNFEERGNIFKSLVEEL